MLSSANPVMHLKHAWDNTHGWAGKACIVLFYIFLWCNIVMNFVQIVRPSSFNSDCFWKGESEYGMRAMQGLNFQSSLFALGFFLYADRGGIRFWNVTMVLIVSFLSWFTMYEWMNHYASLEGAPKHCMGGSNWMMWMWIGWIGAAWLLSIVEQVAGNRASSRGGGGSGANESTPLV